MEAVPLCRRQLLMSFRVSPEVQAAAKRQSEQGTIPGLQLLLESLGTAETEEAT